MAAINQGGVPADAEARMSTVLATQLAIASASLTLLNAAHQLAITVPANALLFVAGRFNMWVGTGTSLARVHVDGVAAQQNDGTVQSGVSTTSGTAQSYITAEARDGLFLGGHFLSDGLGENFAICPLIFQPSAGAHTVDIRFSNTASNGAMNDYWLYAWTMTFGT